MSLRSLFLPVLRLVGMTGCTSLPAVNPVPAQYQSGDLLMARPVATDKTRKLYEGMSRCTLHDREKEKVWADIMAWMDARLPASPVVSVQ